MAKLDKDAYDVIIIGAGIGGLVCGSYLAKAGLKVLIAERHVKAGGYCTSFRRKEFTFDAAAHSFGGYRKGGVVRNVFEDLQVDKQLTIKRSDPTDIITTPDGTVSFRTDLEKTVIGFQRQFPAEKENILKFFNFLAAPGPGSFAGTRKWTFGDLLDSHFNDERLKAVLSFPLYGNGGLPASSMSALIGAKLYMEFLLDGGYYPETGMQALSDAIARQFKEFGGELRLSCPVTRILVDKKRVTGAILRGDEFLPTNCVVSNADARQTYLDLLGRNHLTQDFLDDISSMTPSVSMFVLYLGIDKHFSPLPEPGVNVWFLPHYRPDALYAAVQKGALGPVILMRVLPDRKSIFALAVAPFKSKEYWAENKERLLNRYIGELERFFVPGLSKHIVYKEAATPHTLHRYTLNSKGAAYGWAATPAQLAIPAFRKSTFVQGLYLTGHWTTQGIGIPGVVYVGQDTASAILKKLKKHENMLN
jgi:phytoene dehydrogenase-like protein